MTDTLTHPSDLTQEELAAVLDVPRRVITAWAAQDAAAFADAFDEGGTMILPGAFATGQQAIGEFMAHAFAGPYKNSRVTGTPFHLRRLSDDTVLMLTEGGVVQPGEENVRPEHAVRASWLLVRAESQWKLAAYQNCPRD